MNLSGFKLYWKQIVLMANFISICFLCETLNAEWGFEVSWLHPILPPPHLGCFLVQLLLLLNLPTCVCQRVFFDDKIWIDYKRMPLKVYFSFLKKAGNLRGSNPRETSCRRKWKNRNRPKSTHQCHFFATVESMPKIGALSVPHTLEAVELRGGRASCLYLEHERQVFRACLRSIFPSLENCIWWEHWFAFSTRLRSGLLKLRRGGLRGWACIWSMEELDTFRRSGLQYRGSLYVFSVKIQSC